MGVGRKNFKQDFSYCNTEAGIETSTAKLLEWYQKLDDEMKGVVSAFSEADLKKEVERPGGFKAPVDIQLDIYLQALLIFFGKITIILYWLLKAVEGDKGNEQ